MSNRLRGDVLRSRVWRSVFFAAIVGALSLLTVGGSAHVARAGGGSCSSGSTTFAYTGGEQCYTVPTGVTQLRITAHGAQGGSTSSAAGGQGAVARGIVTVTPGETLYVEVGGAGATSGSSSAFNGGGAAGSSGNPVAAGGGGATDVRTVSCGQSGCTTIPTLNSRLIVAGGGGGAGSDGNAGSGPAGGAGGDAGVSGSAGTGGGGGGHGTSSAGGSGGAGSGASQEGTAGAAGVGGDGGPSGPVNTNADGGGGGGGYYGGGGGGAVAFGSTSAGGGGGGSSHGPSGTTFSTASGAASVTIALGSGVVAATTPATEVTKSSAVLNAAIDDAGNPTSYHFEWGTTTSYGNSTATKTLAGSTGGAQSVSAAITGLSADTTYHFRVVAGTVFGNDVTFTTPAPPTVTTGAATATDTTAQLAGTIKPNGQATTYHFDYGTTTAYGSSTDDATLSSTTGTQDVTAAVSGLSPDTTYHFRLVATSAGGTTNGADATFTTPLPPPVSTGSVTGVTDTTATAAGTVDPQGIATTYHFEYGTTTAYGNMTSSRDIAAGAHGAQDVTAKLTGLDRSATYHLRLVAENAHGTSYGDDVTFTTESGAPAVTTGEPTDLTSPASGAGSAQFNGTVDTAGYRTTYHFEYHVAGSSATSSTPDQTLPASSGAQTVSAPADDLVPQRSYRVVLVATNANGTTTGDAQSFSTPERAPTVQTCCGVDATTTSVTLRGFVLTAGAGTYHFEYGLTDAYGHSTPEQPYGDTKTPIVLEHKISGLSPHTPYHFRLVATNDGGTTNGDDEIFGTATGSAVPPPEVVSAAADDNGVQIVLHGVVNTRGVGGVAYFEYGPGYLSDQTVEVPVDPTTDDQPIVATVDLSSLQAAQGYVFQLAVTTTGGSAGLAGAFTVPALPADVSNQFVSGVTESAATIQCLVNPHGAATDVRVTYTATGPASAKAPSADDYNVQHTTPVLSLAAGIRLNVTPVFHLTGLDPGTVYAFRCRGSNSAGDTIADPEGGFTTATPSVPTVSTGGFHVLPGETRADLSALVDPGGKNTDYFFQYGLTNAYGNQVDSTDQVAGIADPTTVDLVAQGLNANTTYHYRAGVRHADGTVVYGSDEVFTTGKPSGDIAVQSAQAVGATLQVEIENLGLEKGAQFRVDAVTADQFAQTGFDQAFQSHTTSDFQAVPADQYGDTYTVNLRNLQPGTTYYAIVRFQQTFGGGTQNWEEPGLVSFQTSGFVATEPATTIARTGAILNGIASGPGPYRFVYYPLEHPSDTTTVQTIESYPDADELTHESYSANVTGLDPGTHYVFNLVGSDRQGTSTGFDTLGGVCPDGSQDVDAKEIEGTQFTVSGCWMGATKDGDLPTGTTTYTGVGSLTISGMSFTPANDNGTVTINTDNHSLTTSGPENIAVGTTGLYSADEPPLSVAFAASDSHFALAANQVSATAALFGFPLAGATVISPDEEGGSEISMLLGMPAIFGSDFGMNTTLSVDADGTVEEPELKLATPAAIGPLKLPNLALEHKKGTEWDGEAALQLPGAGIFAADKAVEAKIQITGDQLTGFAVAADGLEIPLGATGVTLTEIGADLGDNPFHLAGDIGLDVGPEIGKFAALNIDAGLYLAINSDEELPDGIPGVTAGKEIHSPFTLKVHGDASLLGFIPIGGAEVDYYGLSQPFVAFSAGIDANFSVGDCAGQDDPAFGVTAKGKLSGAFQGQDFNLEGNLGVSLRFACVTIFGAEADTAISSDGIGFCGTLTTAVGSLSVGAGENWGSPGTSMSSATVGKNLDYYVPGGDNGACSISDYEHQFDLGAAHAAGKRGAAIPDLTFPAGKRFVVVKFVGGKAGPPLVHLAGPDGRTVSTKAGVPTIDTKHGFLVLPDSRTDVTTVSIANPGTGAYHVTLEKGSPPLVSVETAAALPPPNVHAQVLGHGATRTLVWHANKIAGQTLQFEESGAAGQHTIVSTSKSSGSVTFRPLAGKGGQRNVVVVVFEHGAQREIDHAATFRAPKPQPPALVRDLRARRHGNTVAVTWAGHGQKPDHYIVKLTTTSGLVLRQRVTKTQASFSEVPTGFNVTVRVHGVSRVAGLAGEIRRTTLHAGLHLRIRDHELGLRGRDIRVPLACRSRRCEAVVEATMLGAHGPMRVGLHAVRMRDGQHKRLVLHLTKKVEQALAAHGKATVTLAASTPDGRAFTRKVRLRLRKS